MDKHIQAVLFPIFGYNCSIHSFSDVTFEATNNIRTINQIWYKRLSILISMLKEAPNNFFLLDVDALWINDPFPYLQSIHRQYTYFQPSSPKKSTKTAKGTIQIIASRGNWPTNIYERWGATLCMGFFYLTNNQFNQNLIEKARTLLMNQWTQYQQDRKKGFLSVTGTTNSMTNPLTMTSRQLLFTPRGTKSEIIHDKQFQPLETRTQTKWIMDDQSIINHLLSASKIQWYSDGYDHIDIHSKSQRNKLQFITNNQTDVGLIQETNIILLLSHQYFPRKCFPYNFFGNNTEQEMNLQYFQSHYFPNASTTNLFIMNHTTTTSSSSKSFILHCTSFTGSAEKKIYFFRKLGLWKLDKFKYS
jgi:hypothetical protein